MDGTELEYDPSPRRAMPPALLASLVINIALVALTVASLISAGTTLVLCFPINMLIYLATGALAGYVAQRQGSLSTEYGKIGAQAGLLAWVWHLIATLVLGSIFGFATLGFGFLGLIGGVLCAPLVLAVQVGFGAIGGMIYRNFSGVSAYPA